MAGLLNDDGFIKSENICVYPCAFRGEDIDQEAKMMTENTISHISPLIFENNGYVINHEAGGKQSLEFCIAGYYFKIFETTVGDFINSFNSRLDWYACITLVSWKLFEKDSSSSRLLVRFGMPSKETGTPLDVKEAGGDQYYFYGVKFMNQPSEWNIKIKDKGSVNFLPTNLKISGTLISQSTFTRAYKQLTDVNPSFTYEAFTGSTGKTMCDLINAMENNSILVAPISDGTNTANSLCPDQNYQLGVLEILRYNENRCTTRYTALSGAATDDPTKMWFGETQMNQTTSELVWSGWREVLDTESTQEISGEKTFTKNLKLRGIDDVAVDPSVDITSSIDAIDKNGKNKGGIEFWHDLSGQYQVRLYTRDPRSSTEVKNSIIYETQANGNQAVYPLQPDIVDLGYSDHKWKSLYLAGNMSSTVVSLPAVALQETETVNIYKAELPGWTSTPGAIFYVDTYSITTPYTARVQLQINDSLPKNIHIDGKISSAVNVLEINSVYIVIYDGAQFWMTKVVNCMPKAAYAVNAGTAETIDGGTIIE